ncbi:MAG: electron transport complex subunit RsxC [Deltaproteobacteria bacterium]|nr:electron transport complex subunit RsxC [Deltaproteobacteria bacterium]
MNQLPVLDIRLSFRRGGVHMDDHKVTAAMPIERFLPKEVVLPLSQHIGPEATAIVKRKDTVTRGMLIGAEETLGAPVHASVNGTVKSVIRRPHPTLTEASAIVIETNAEATDPQFEEDPEWRRLSQEEMLTRIAKAGIVGLGGASFPTHRKLRLPPGVRIDTLIINGAECEPYLTSDHRLMLERTEDLVKGACLIGRIVDARQIIIGIEDNKADAAAMLQKTIDDFSDTMPRPWVRVCKTRYPQGSEKQLVEALANRVIPSGKLPMHVGCLVQNVATAIACYRAIRFREPLMDRVVTVSGKGIRTPKNLLVPIGTLISDIVLHCGGMTDDACMVIAGGPMMGRALSRLDVPVIKGTGGLLFFTEDQIEHEMYGPCISCGRCLDVCPLGLEPNQISLYTEAGLALETLPFGTRDCFECGSCAYVCPAKRPLTQFIQIAKSALMRKTALGIAVRPGGPHG